MKKLLILTSAFCITAVAYGIYSQSCAAEDLNQPVPAKVQQVRQGSGGMQNRMDNAFERRLELTEVQKLKAREIRKKGHTDLQPVMDDIAAKKREAEIIRRSKMSVQAQEEKLTVIDNELKELEKNAVQIRKSNMKEFESILTRQQKKTLKEMKKEGRNNYREAHPNGHLPPGEHAPVRQAS